MLIVKFTQRMSRLVRKILSCVGAEQVIPEKATAEGPRAVGWHTCDGKNLSRVALFRHIDERPNEEDIEKNFDKTHLNRSLVNQILLHTDANAWHSAAKPWNI